MSWTLLSITHSPSRKVGVHEAVRALENVSQSSKFNVEGPSSTGCEDVALKGLLPFFGKQAVATRKSPARHLGKPDR